MVACYQLLEKNANLISVAIYKMLFCHQTGDKNGSSKGGGSDSDGYSKYFFEWCEGYSTYVQDEFELFNSSKIFVCNFEARIDR